MLVSHRRISPGPMSGTWGTAPTGRRWLAPCSRPPRSGGRSPLPHPRLWINADSFEFRTKLITKEIWSRNWMHVKLTHRIWFQMDWVAGYFSHDLRFSPSESARRSQSVRPATYHRSAREEHDAMPLSASSVWLLSSHQNSMLNLSENLLWPQVS